MKWTTILFMLFAFKLHAFEIQCSTQVSDLSLIVKTSEASQVTYLLFFNQVDLEKYYVLNSPNWSDSQNFFNYKDSDTLLHIDKLNRNGSLLSSGNIIRDFSSLDLRECFQVN